MKPNILFTRIKNLFINTDQEWKTIQSESNTIAALNKNVLFPLLILNGITQVLGFIFDSGMSVIVDALLSSLAHLAAIFLGIQISVYVLTKLNNAFDIEIKKELAYTLIVYSIVPYLVSNAFINFHPATLYFLKLIYLFSIVHLWKGSEYILLLKDNRRLSFVIISTALIFVSIQASLTLLINILPIEIIKIA